LQEQARRIKSGPIPALEEFLKTAKPHGTELDFIYLFIRK